MKTNNLPRGASGPLLETEVLAFLHDHPDFFLRHPGLVETLRIPHSCGGAVSLIQYQVQVLRERTQRLRRSMQELLANARDNEKLSQRLHRLTLRLMECGTLGNVFDNLYEVLYNEFKADAAAVRLLVTPRAASDRGRAEFGAGGDQLTVLFAQAFAARNPVCGRLLKAQRECLFQEQAAAIVSGVVVPLGGAEPVGVMAIGSRDGRRFHPAMGTVFLRQLGDIITRVTAPFLA